jgi:hypothetical protein
MKLGSMTKFALFSVLCVFGTNVALADDGGQSIKKHQTLERIKHTEAICNRKADLLNTICRDDVGTNVSKTMKACDQTEPNAKILKGLDNSFNWVLPICKSATDAYGLKLDLKFEFKKICIHALHDARAKCIIDAYEARKAFKDSQKD